MIFMMRCYFCKKALVSQAVLKGKVKIKGAFSAPFVHSIVVEDKKARSEIVVQSK